MGQELYDAAPLFSLDIDRYTPQDQAEIIAKHRCADAVMIAKMKQKLD